MREWIVNRNRREFSAGAIKESRVKSWYLCFVGWGICLGCHTDWRMVVVATAVAGAGGRE